MASCKCGCGKDSAAGDFIRGHDQKLRVRLEHEVGGLCALEELVAVAQKYAASELSESVLAREVQRLFTAAGGIHRIDPAESHSIELLCEMQRHLDDALKSLEGKESGGLMGYFMAYSARYISRAADGYICLRKAYKTDAARLLIRPAIEAMVKVVAVQKQPDVLYRIAFTEAHEYTKLARTIVIQSGRDFDSKNETSWIDFKQEVLGPLP